MHLLFSLLATDAIGGITPPPDILDKGCEDEVSTIFLVVITSLAIIALIFAFCILARFLREEKNQTFKTASSNKIKNSTETKNSKQSQSTTFENQPLTPDEQELLANYRKSKKQNNDNENSHEDK